MRYLVFILTLNLFTATIYSDTEYYTLNSKMTTAVYYPGWKLITKARIDSVISFCVNNSLNTIIVDIKNVKGELFYISENFIAKNVNTTAKTADGINRTINFNYLKNEANQKGIRIVGRFVMFRDEQLYDYFPEYRMEDKEKWVDFRSIIIQNYNFDLLKEVVKLPIDEIALDYIRFPDIAGFGSNSNKIKRITNIVYKASQITRDSEIDLSIFVFGWVAWNRKQNIGQSIPHLVPHVDTIYPMLYPSHFYPGSLGFNNPSDHPYEIIEQGYYAATKLSQGKPIIPMLQIFWYGPVNILEQIKAVYDNNMPGFGCWNAAGNYQLLSQAFELLELENN